MHRSRRQAAPGTGAPAAHRRRARKGEGDKLRTEILDAAERLLGEKGSPDYVSMRAIAAAVGVSAPAIYMHFDDKDELFFECCSRRFHELAEVIAKATESHDDPVAKIRAIGRAYIDFGLTRPEHYEVLMLGPIPDKAVDEPEEAPGARVLVLVAEIVAGGMKSGVFRGDLEPLATAVALWASVHGATIVLLAKRRQPVKLFDDEEQVIEQLLDIIGRGLIA
jgi:AcrR family transcriptional regulator